ncbi:MAG TPA: PE-PPE domain-containing protein [Mycobacterium sp.]|nr:PE-PPE domain-containing protein [Mycobacterium sp.]
MTSRTRRSLRIASLAIAGAITVGAAPAVTPAVVAGVKTVMAEATLLDTESWIMGGSGLPIPPPSYLTAVSERFIDPTAYPHFSGGQPLFTGQPQFPVDSSNALFTPEGLYPLTGVKTLELDPSLSQGVQILNNTINGQIAEGNNLIVLGYSQSATINSLEMKSLLALPPAEQPTAEQLAFVLLGDPSNPDGGLLSRFAVPGVPLTIPSVGITFSGATPSDTPWDTAIYTQEYDGFADFPKYPLNFLSDLNAFLGIMFVHGSYPSISADKIGTAIQLPVSDDYTGHTQYFMIPTETLPLAQLISSIPLIGKPIADLLEPDLRILVNLGYGSTTDGWDPGPANVATPFGLFPDSVSPGEVISALAQGTQEGFSAFANDLLHPSLPSVADVISNGAAGGLPSLTDIVNAFTSAMASGYATLLPTADIINFLVTTLPAYNVSLFLHELASGNLLNAVGMPIAADVGLSTMAAGFEVEVVMNTVSEIEAAFKDLIPS